MCAAGPGQLNGPLQSAPGPRGVDDDVVRPVDGRSRKPFPDIALMGMSCIEAHLGCTHFLCGSHRQQAYRSPADDRDTLLGADTGDAACVPGNRGRLDEACVGGGETGRERNKRPRRRPEVFAHPAVCRAPRGVGPCTHRLYRPASH